MFVEPRDLDRDVFVAALARTWEISVRSLRYEPVGFGTHHYVVDDDAGARWFVNVDDVFTKSWIASDPAQTADALNRALRSAVALRKAGLEFVHAPIEASDGAVVNLMDERYAVSVFNYVDGRSNEFGKFASDDERRLVLNAVGRMHSATERIPRDLPRTDTLDIPQRRELFVSLDELSTTWTGGPFAEPARELLATRVDEVRAMFARYDSLVPAVRARIDDWVVTHGEPHGSNIIRTPDGGLLMIDWDTVAIGPRERDLWMVEPRDTADWDAYTSSGGAADVDPGAIELYNLWWALSEITGYIDTFRRPHVDDANTQVAWRELQNYLPAAVTGS